MKATTCRTVAVGLVVFAAACSEQPVAPDVKQVTPGTQDVKPGGGATESLVNNKIHEIFPPGATRSQANAFSGQIKDLANAGDLEGSFQAAIDLLELAVAEGGDPLLVQELAVLLTQWYNELGGFDAGFGVALAGAEIAITANSAEAGIVVPAGGVNQTTIFTIALIPGGCLDTDIPQSNECYRYTAIPDLPFAFGLPATLGECIDPGFVKLSPPAKSQEHLIRLHAQDVVNSETGETKVVSLPLVDLDQPQFDDFLSCDPAVVSIESPSGLFGLAQAGWRKLKGGLASVLSPEPLHANATLAASKGYGGTKGSLTDVAGGLPVEMTISAGNDQTGGVGSRTATDPAVVVTDADGGFVAGATVHWEVTFGNGNVMPIQVETGNDGIASVAWTLGDAGTHAIEAFAHGIADPLDAGESFNGCLPPPLDCFGPFADDPNEGVVELLTGKLQFTAEAILAGGGELVVINDVNVFDDVGTLNPGNETLINNLVSFFNADPRGSQTIVWFDRGRSSKCFDFTGCTDTDLGTMRGNITTAGFMVVDNNTGSGNRYSSIPAGVKVIFLWNPTVSFQKKEVGAIKDFLIEGGRVILVGENRDFVGATGISAANRLLKDLKAPMRVNSDNVDCGQNPTITTNIGANPIMTGVINVSIDCASSMTMEGEELFSSSDDKWVAGVAITLP